MKQGNRTAERREIFRVKNGKESVLGEALIQENLSKDKKMGSASKTGTTLLHMNLNSFRRATVGFISGRGLKGRILMHTDFDLGAVNAVDACVGNVDGKI